MTTRNLIEAISPTRAGLLDFSIVHPGSDQVLGVEYGSLGLGVSGAVYTANMLIFYPFAVARPVRVTQFWWENDTAVSGNSDVGIYSTALVKLGSCGSTANAGTSTIQIANATAAFNLPINQRLWLALGCDNGTQRFRRSSSAVALGEFIGVKQQASGWSSGLPTTPVFDATITFAQIPIFGFGISLI
jgi:hypothetical protein